MPDRPIPNEPSAYVMRAPCRRCSASDGRIEVRAGQNCVFCLGCGLFAYNAPKVETGQEPRSLRSRPDIKPSLRARVIERDNGTCVGCHRSDVPIQLGHLLSVEDGRRLGATDAELYSEENLAAMCEECNSGFGGHSISLRLVYRILQARQARRA